MTVNTDNLKIIENAYHAFHDSCRLVMVDDDCDTMVVDAIKCMLDGTDDGYSDVIFFSKQADQDIEDEEEKLDREHEQTETRRVRGV